MWRDVMLYFLLFMSNSNIDYKRSPIFQVLEDSAENFSLLIDAGPESLIYNSILSAIEAFHTQESKAMLTDSLQKMMQTTNCPIVIAWDPQSQKAGALLLPHSLIRSPKRNLDYSTCSVAVRIVFH